MKRLTGTVLTLAAVVSLAATATAQTKVIPGEEKTATATVESIEASTRTLTLKGPEGNYVTMTVPETVKKFDQIKVGDTLTAKYYDSIILRLKPEGEKATDTLAGDVPTAGSTKPAGTLGAQRRLLPRLPRSIRRCRR